MPDTVPARSGAWRLCIAPMMQRTDRHFRYLARSLSPHARLYTEMISTGAILRGDRERHLRFDAREHPLGVQLGGSRPAELAACARICAERGYDEINLNCGCPSDRVQAADFGACLMRTPALVADGVKAMLDVLPQGVTLSVKTRLGIDDLYSYEYFRDFIATLYEAGCSVFHVHARKAWLSGLSPRENREIPPLNYAWVERLKREFPAAVVVINGGITTVAQALEHLRTLDGVMLGRCAYDDPCSLIAYDAALFGDAAARTAHDVVIEYLDYVSRELTHGTQLKHISRHLLNMFQGRPGAKLWRRHLTEHSAHAQADGSVILAALDALAPLSHAPAQSAVLRAT